MANDRRPLDDLAAAVLDGEPVDWGAVESTSPPAERDVIRHLRLVARIAETHRLASPADVPLSEQTARRSDEARPALETWGHLKILGRVGSGAFGDVYRAWDSRLDRSVALKLLEADDSGSEGSTIISEASHLARVRHPNVVTVYGAERLEGRVGLWMELVEGHTLQDLLAEKGPFSAHEAALIGLCVCRALSAVHRAGLLHRDIKAQNVMRENGGRILLMDFGAGKSLAGTSSVSSAPVAGTPLYLAPELFAGAEASVQSDLYSVGVLLFHLVTESFPVAGASVQEVRQAHLEGRRQFLRDERPDLSDEFVTVVEQAIVPEPGQRFQSAGAMEAALARVVAPRAHRPPAWWLLGALAAASLVAALAFLTPQSWRERALQFGGGASGAGAGPPGENPTAAATSISPTVVRKVPVPSGYLVGKPSADGRLFSYSDDDGNLALFELATGQTRRLTSHEAETDQHAMFSAISADGRFVAYTWWALDGRYEMRVIGTDGKRPRVVLRSDSIEEPWPLEWSRDGRSILAILMRKDGTSQLALVGVEDGAVRVVRDFKTDPPQNASLSPDGELVVYDALQAGSDRVRDLFVVRADGSDDRVLFQHPANDLAPVFSPDGQRVIFASDRSGAMDVWSVALDGADDPELVHRNIGRMRVLGLTDQGSYYHQLLVGTVEVYSAELSEDGPVGRPKALGSSYVGSNISSAWSPDGRQVAYASRRGLVGFDRRSTTLVIRDLATDQTRELVPAMNSFLLFSWSPDGRQILVTGTDARSRSGDLALDVQTGHIAPMTPTFARAEWMPDGRRILYIHPERRAVLLRDVQSGSEEVALDFRKEGVDGIRAGGQGRGFKLSPDGRTLAFSAMVRDGQGWTLRLKTGDEPSRELFQVNAPDSLVFQDWTPDGDALLFTRRQGTDAHALWRISASGGAPEPLGLSMKGLRDVSVHPGGRRITFTGGWPVLEVWMVENVLSARSPSLPKQR